MSENDRCGDCKSYVERSCPNPERMMGGCEKFVKSATVDGNELLEPLHEQAENHEKEMEKISEASEEKRYVPRIGGVEDDYIYEQVVVNGEFNFALHIKSPSNKKIVANIESELVTPDVTVTKGLYKKEDGRIILFFPEDPDLADVDRIQLWNDIYAFIKENIDLPDEREYILLTAFAHLTWIFDRFDYTPYVFFLGLKHSGKSRGENVLVLLCRRPIWGSTVSESALGYCYDLWHPTYFLDEAQTYWAKDSPKAESLGMFNCGYKRLGGSRIVRSGEGGLDVYNCFCPKVFASTQSGPSTLMSRSFVIRMRKTTKAYPDEIDEGKALKIRNQLLSWSLTIFDAKIVSCYREIMANTANDGRLAEIGAPLLWVCPNDEIKEQLLAYFVEVAMSRIEEDRGTFEAEIFLAALDVESQGKVDSGRIFTADILEQYNQGKPEKSQIKSRTVGRNMSKMGFKAYRKNKKRGWWWDDKLVNDLIHRFYPERLPMGERKGALEQYFKTSKEGDEKS